MQSTGGRNVVKSNIYSHSLPKIGYNELSKSSRVWEPDECDGTSMNQGTQEVSHYYKACTLEHIEQIHELLVQDFL